MLNPNTPSEDEVIAALESEIIVAILGGNPQKALELLRDPRIDPEHPKKQSRNIALWCASEYGYTEVVSFLLNVRHVNPTLRPAGHTNVLVDPSKNGHTKIVELLLKDERFSSSDCEEAAIYAIDYDHVEILKLLLSYPTFEPTWRGLRMMATACYGSDNRRRPHKEAVSMLLSDGKCDPSDSRIIGNTAGFGNTEIVELLLADNRVDPSVENNLAIRYASESGHTEVVKLLLDDPRVNPADNNDSAIRQASQNGHANVVRLLFPDPRISLQAKDEAMRNMINSGNSQIAAEIAFNRFGVFSHVAGKKIDDSVIPPEIPKVIIEEAIEAVKKP